MFVWQGSVELACSAYVIVGYTTGYWFHLRTVRRWSLDMMRDLKRREINRFDRRVARLLGDVAFWLSLMFGALLVFGSAWYAGLRAPLSLAYVAGGWALIAILLNFEMTVLFPTTRCRKCDYQLLPQLNPEDLTQVVLCPECGSHWTKSDLFLTPRTPIGIEASPGAPTIAAQV